MTNAKPIHVVHELVEHHPMFDAVRSGDAALVRTLLQQGGDIPFYSRPNMALLETALLSDHGETVALPLIDSPLGEPSLYEGQQTPLMACLRSETLLRAMVARGFSVHAVVNGSSPINHCIGSRWTTPAMMALLTENGTSTQIHARATNGMSRQVLPIHLAAIHRRIDFVEHLLSLGVPLDTPDANGKNESALHLAVTGFRSSLDTDSGSIEKFAQLIALCDRHGVPVDSLDTEGCTPLHVACLYRARVPSIVPLLGAGADPARRNANGATPSDIARQAGNTDALAIIDAFLARQAIAGIAGTSFNEPQP